MAQEAQRAELGPSQQSRPCQKTIKAARNEEIVEQHEPRMDSKSKGLIEEELKCSRRSSTHYGVHLDPEERAVAWLTRHAG